MSTQQAVLLGGGVLVVLIASAALGAPALVWLTAALVTMAVGTFVVARIARSQGIDLARELARHTAVHGSSRATGQTASSTADRAVADEARTERVDGAEGAVAVEVTLVRPAADGAAAVWLHRRGGRRVHRYATDGGWVVEQVTTRDPDHPRKRTVGEPRVFSTEDEATRAADEVALGILPQDLAAARALGVPPLAAAEARRRRVKLTGREQARRLASEWGMLAGA